MVKKYVEEAKAKNYRGKCHGFGSPWKFKKRVPRDENHQTLICNGNKYERESNYKKNLASGMSALDKDKLK